jgi:membrane protease YdiL (CAAX protease family)
VSEKLQDAAAALALMLAVWSLLIAGRVLDPLLGRKGSVFVTFLLATAIVLATRAAGNPCSLKRGTLLFTMGASIGFAGYPAWVVLIGWAGAQLDLPPIEAIPAPRAKLLLVSSLVLAPVFEEILYRERLLAALAPLTGVPLAIMLSSGLFALSHVNDWSVVTTLLVGLILGVTAQFGRSVAPCIGVHMGLNFAALLCGVPPSGLLLPVPAAALVGFGGLGLLAGIARRGSLEAKPSPGGGGCRGRR